MTNNKDDEYVDLEKLSKSLKPGESIVVLSGPDNKDNKYRLIIGDKNGKFDCVFNEKSYNSLKSMIEVYNEKAILVEDITIDGVKIELDGNYNGLFLTIENQSVPVTFAEFKSINEIIKNK